MEKDRQTKIMTIAVLLVGIITLSIGFAAFGSRLVIGSKAKVSPDANSFKVVLSKEENNETVGTIKPIGMGGEATISNTDGATISNIKANFVNPGEKVVYEFYAVNVGDLDAYLNMIEYNSVTGNTENKVCTADEGTNADYVASACNSIRVTVKVGNDDKACQTSTYDTHKLVKKQGEKVVVEIEYNQGGARADGPFEVEFGDISLNYSTVDKEIKNVPACDEYETRIISKLDINDRTTVTDNDGNNKFSVGDKVTLDTESFYVISADEDAGTVAMLTQYNLNVGYNVINDGTEGRQNPACLGQFEYDTNVTPCTLEFSTEKYWTTINDYVYNENSSIYPYVEAYENILKEKGWTSASGRLIKKEEMDSLGCDSVSQTCASAPSWVTATTFWTGTSADWGTRTWRYLRPKYYYNFTSTNADEMGVRPVIIVNVDDIK